jgi:ABC-type branched-subunit amino acid transport system substrate-binding protein
MLRSTFLGGAVAAVTSTATVPTTILQQLTLGVNVPLTGPYGQYGLEVAKGVRAAVDETNKYNATLTKAYGVRTFDDQSSGAIATSNVLVAGSDPTIVGMIGNLTLDITMTTLPQYANAGFALVVPTVTGDALTKQGYHNIFRLPASNTAEGQLFASAVLKKRTAENVLAVVVDKDYGAETAAAFVKQAKNDKHNAQLVTLEANADVPDSTAILLGRSPNYVFMAGHPEKLGPIAVAMRMGGYMGDFGFADSFYSADVVKTYGKSLSGALVASSLPPLNRVPSAVGYYQDFNNEVGAITAFSAYGYAAAQLLIQAAQRANATTRFQVLTQLQEGGTYNLLVGQYFFNPFGDPQLPNIYLFTLGADGFTYDRSGIQNGFVI